MAQESIYKITCDNCKKLLQQTGDAPDKIREGYLHILLLKELYKGGIEKIEWGKSPMEAEGTELNRVKRTMPMGDSFFCDFKCFEEFFMALKSPTI